MTRLKRTDTDQISANPSHPVRPSPFPASLSSVTPVFLLLVSLAGCGKTPEGNPPPAPNESSRASSSGIDASQVIERYRALDDSRDSTIKMRAQITDLGESREEGAPRQIQLTMYTKREPDGQLLILVEFTTPAEERDRDGLITVSPDGRTDVVRYMQSTDTFIVAGDPTSEDSLFGLTPQELAGGQPEKYDFTLLGEETYEATPVYRLEGRLRRGAESKFPRVVLLISKQDYTAMQAEFYDNRKDLARRLSVSKIEQIAGHWTRTRWTIDNRARQKKLDFEAVDVKYDQDLSDSVFTREHLKKIASR